RLVLRLHYQLQKRGGCFLLRSKEPLLTGAARNIKQQRNRKWHLLRIANARNLLLLAFFQQTKVSDLESLDRTPGLIGYRHGHHHEGGSGLDNILDHIRLRLWRRRWLRSPGWWRRRQVFDTALSMNSWYRQKKGQHSNQERRPQDFFLNREFHRRHPR